jgi:pullulanase
MLRTKPDGHGGFDDNSYRASDLVNALKWEDLSKQEYLRNVAYYQGLLAFRKAHPALRLQTRQEVLAAVKPVAVDDNIVTGNGPSAASTFALTIVAQTLGREASLEVAEGMLIYPTA